MDKLETLRGLRILIAEDNWLIGESLRQILLELECAVVGPIADLGEVMTAIERGDFDAALLDIQLGDANILPAATALAARGIPFILTTGAGIPASDPAILATAPRLKKPYDASALEAAMKSVFLPRARTAPAAC